MLVHHSKQGWVRAIILKAWRENKTNHAVIIVSNVMLNWNHAVKCFNFYAKPSYKESFKLVYSLLPFKSVTRKKVQCPKHYLPLTKTTKVIKIKRSSRCVRTD